DQILRDAFAGMGANYFFSVDPTKAGGASMRVIIERINKTVKKRQRMIRQALARIYGYAVSKAIKLGLLRWSPEWWNWNSRWARRSPPTEGTIPRWIRTSMPANSRRSKWCVPSAGDTGRTPRISGWTSKSVYKIALPKSALISQKSRRLVNH